MQVLTEVESHVGSSLGSDAVRAELGDAFDPEFSVLFLLAPFVSEPESVNMESIDFVN